MKKPKISLDKDKIQAFFLNHVEKLLLVIVVGLMFMLVWRGFALPHLDDKKSPQGLVGESDRAKQYVNDQDRWINEVRHEREVLVAVNVAKEVEKSQIKTDPLAYMFLNSLHRPDFPKLSPRKDPELFPPERLVVRPVIGPLASLLKPTEAPAMSTRFIRRVPMRTIRSSGWHRESPGRQEKGDRSGSEYGTGGEGGMTGRTKVAAAPSGMRREDGG
jgi:hypothetical protein